MNAQPFLPKPPNPTGNPWLFSPDDPATVPIPVPVIIVGVEGPYTEQDRKLWVFLLHAVWDELGDKPVHEIRIRDINSRFRKREKDSGKTQKGGRHHSDWIWESATRLADTRVRWIRTDGDKRYKGIGRLLSAETDDEVREEGILRFSFDPLLVPILKDPRRFARLRTHFMIDLSGKYTVTLYELLESVANKEMPVLDGSVEDLRRWLKVPEGKLSRWQDFRRRVLEPAVEQINDEPTHGAGFTVKYTPRKEGRAFKGVRFELEKTPARLKMERELQDKEKQLALPFRENDAPIIDAEFSSASKDVSSAQVTPQDNADDGDALVVLLVEAGLSKRDANKIAREKWEFVDSDAHHDYPKTDTEKAFTDYIREKVDLLKRSQDQKKVKNPTGFLLKAIKENYANPEFIEKERQSSKVKAIVAQKKRREQLEEEKEQLQSTYSDACGDMCEAILRDNPDELAGLIQAAVEENPFLRKYCVGDVPEEQYRESAAVSGSVNMLMKERYPERFRAINEDYQPRLAALDSQIAALQ